VYPAKQPGVLTGGDNDGHNNPESALIAGLERPELEERFYEKADTGD
jgi:hypothetical protein